MAVNSVAPRKSARKPRPHIVRRKVGEDYQYYVYAFRGGPCVLRQYGERPTREQAQTAALSIYQKPVQSPQPLAPFEVLKRGRGITAHRPLFIRELIRLLADSDRWTYFLADGQGAVKIGAAADVDARVKILQAHNSGSLRLLAKVRGGEALESAHHSWFAPHRVSNEWFALHPEIMAEVEYLYKHSRKTGDA